MEIPLLFRCSECGYNLRAEYVVMYNGDQVIHVDPCQYCLEDVEDRCIEEFKTTFNGCLDRGD